MNDKKNKMTFKTSQGETIEIALEVITPKMAIEYLKANKNNRPIKKRSLSMYCRDIEAGNWKVNGESIKFDRHGNLGDGQHRLQACVRTGIAIETFVVRALDPEINKTVDKGVKRTAADYLSFKNVSNSALIAAAICRYKSLANSASDTPRDKSEMFSTSEVAEVYQQDSEFFDNVAMFAKNIYKRNRLLKAAYVAGLMAFLIREKKHPQEKVERFFAQIADIETACSAVRVLRQKLMLNQADKVNSMNSIAKEIVIKRAWNAYCTGRDIKTLSYNLERDKNLQFL